MNDIYLGQGKLPTYLYGKYANRHGMVAGATGTGKSVSLMLLVEGFSKLGVPSFIADVKGDLAGLSQPGTLNENIKRHIQATGQSWEPAANPVIFWDMYGTRGHSVKTSLSKMGPALVGRVLELNETRQGVLEILFKAAEDNGSPLITLDDLRNLLCEASENARMISKQYGLVSTTSIAAIQRSVLSLSQANADKLFGAPNLDFNDFIKKDANGRGYVNILAAESLILKPKLYTSFLLWLLTELFENLPEVGDLAVPKFVMFFDEAHLLFDDASASLKRRIEQVVRLIRSKGVGAYFCSQKPDDIPEDVLGQLGNRIQHALRAFTIRDQKSVRAAAETFTMNNSINVEEVITQLGVGEALVSTLSNTGTPTPVERVIMATPCCRIGPVTDVERAATIKASPIGTKYDTMPTAINFTQTASRKSSVDSEQVTMTRGITMMDVMLRSIRR